MAAENGAVCVVVRVEGKTIQQLDSVSQYWQLKVFSNMAHSLLVYTRK
jgi:hypothetical protein